MNIVIAFLALAQAATFDQGTYTTYIDGKAVAREGFKITSDGKSSSLISNVSGDLITLRRKTQLTTRDNALGVAVVNVVAEKTITVSLKNGNAVFEAEWQNAPGGKKPQKEITKIPVHASKLFCSEPYAWHNLTFILRAYDKAAGGHQVFEVAMPSQVRTREFVVTRGAERERNNQKIVDWTFGSSTDPEAIQVISDAEGRVLYLKDTRVGAEVIRTGWESLGRPNEPVTPPANPPSNPPDTSSLQPNKDKYDEREVKIWVGSVVYKTGTLLVPKKSGKRPAVLLISGYGPSDRDWNYPPVITNSWARLLADQLAAAGYAVLRTDDRGVGGTNGTKSSSPPDELMSDALMEADFLKKLPEVDPFKIYVCGHSEGATIALMALTTDATLAGGILLAAPSKPMDQAFLEAMNVQQADTRLSQSVRDAAAASIPKINEVIQKAKAGEKGTVNGMYLEWMRQHMQIDPSKLILRVKDPILIVQGLDDDYVPSRNANELETAAKSAGVDVTVEFIPGVDHFFKPFSADMSATGELNPTLWEDINRWLTAKSGK